MATYLIDQGKRLERPTRPFAVDWSSQQALGLVRLYPLGGAIIARDAVRGGVFDGTVGGTLASSGTPLFGLAPLFTGEASGSQYISIPAGSGSVIDTLPLTVTGWARMVTSGVDHDYRTIVSTGAVGGVGGFAGYCYYISLGGGHVNAYDGTGGWLDGGISLPTVEWVHWAVSLNTNDKRIYLNGRVDSTSSTCSPTGVAASCYVGTRLDGAGGTGMDGHLADVRWYNRVLSPAEVWALYDPATRWDLYWVPGRRVFFDVAAAGTIIEPGVGGLVITGQVPTLFTAVNIATGLGSLRFSGLAPVASIAHLIATGAGSLPISGLAPSLSQGLTIATGAGSLPITGQAPTLQRTFQVSPEVGAVTIFGLAPTVSVTTGTVVQPAAGALTISGLAPTASVAHLIATGAGSVQITGQAPTVQSGQLISVSAGSVQFSGLAPTVQVSYRIETGAGQVTFTGYAPSLGGATSITTGAGSLTLTGLMPAISTGIVVMPAAGQVTYTGLAPTLGLSFLVDVPAGSVELDGHTPVVVNSGLLVSTLYVTGTYTPTVNLTGSYRPTINVTGEYQ